MSACSDAIARRFGDGGPSGEGADDNELIRRVLSRKTVRRYSDRMPAEELLDLLVACALSASAKSDFQQASILRVRDPEKRAAIGKLFPAMPWIGIAPVFFVFLGDARRLQRIGEMRGKPVRERNARRLLQRQHRCGACHADHDPVRGIGRARGLSDQRHPQRDRQGRRHSRSARSRLSRRRALPRLPAGRRLCQPAAAARRDDA